MKPVVHGRQPGSKNYTKEFREAVAAEANDPNRSIAEVARAHGLNANMVAQWRRSLLDTQPAPSVPNIALLPVDVVDLPAKDIPHHALPQTPDVGVTADYVYEVKSSSDLRVMQSSTLTLDFTTHTVPNPNPPVIEFADVSNGTVTYKSLTQGASFATAPNYSLSANAQDSGLYVVRLTK